MDNPATPSVSTSLYTTANASTLEANTSVNSEHSELGDSILILEKPNSNDNSFNPEEQGNSTICLDSSGDITSSSIVELCKTSTPMVPFSKRKLEKSIDEGSFSVVIDDGGLNTSSEEDSELDVGEESEGTIEPSNVPLGEASSALPDTVTLLTTPDGGSVYLVGTAHFSKESQDDVSKVIQAVQPHVVLVELCKARVNILQLDEQTILEEAKNINFEKIKSTIQQNGFFHGIMNILLLSMSAHLTKELGMAPGGEFRQAFSEAKKVPNCVVHLGDRPIKLTIQRALASLTWWQTLKLSWHIMSKESISKEQVERCKQRDLLEEMLEQLTGEFPAFSRVFVAERDLYLANSLQLAALPIPCPSAPLVPVSCCRIHTCQSGWCSGNGPRSRNCAALGKSGPRCHTSNHGDSSAFFDQSSPEINNKSIAVGSLCLGMCSHFAVASFFAGHCSRSRELSEESKGIGPRHISVTASSFCITLDQCIWIVLQVWNLFAVYIIISYFLLVSWVTNGDFWDILTKCRIGGLETVNAKMTCAIFKREVRQAGPNCACLDIFYIVYIVVPSKEKTVVRYFGKNPLTKMFWKQSLFCWSMFVIRKGKCENCSENFLKDLICRRKKYILQNEIESVIDIFYVISDTVWYLETFLFPLYKGKSWITNFKFPLADILSTTRIFFLLFSYVFSVAIPCLFQLFMNLNFSFTCRRNISIFLQNNLPPQIHAKNTCYKIEEKRLSSEEPKRVQLLLFDLQKERDHTAGKENGFLINEFGFRMKGNGHDKKGNGEMEKGRKEKREGMKQCQKLGSGLCGGGGSGCGRDDDEDEPPDRGLEGGREEDSSHEEEVFEREPVEPIDDYFHPLPNIFYIPTNVPGPGANVEDFESAYQGCTCAADKNGICHQNCLCVLRSMGPSYNDIGFLLSEKLSGNIPVFECSEYCDCSNNCGNRKVQFGPMTGLSVFETTTNADLCAAYIDNSFKLPDNSFKSAAKGLGLRTLKPVSKGSFICEYAGEIIGSEEASKRWRNDYIQGHPNYILALLEWISQSQSKGILDPSSLNRTQFLTHVKCVDKVRTEERLDMTKIVTYIDPTRVGNIGRYANHSCDPNAIAVTVRVGCPVPRLCLFAAKDIIPGEEVTFDYAGLEMDVPTEVVDASSLAKKDHQWEKQNSSSVCLLPDLHSKVLEEKCGKNSEVASVSTDGNIEGSLSKRSKFPLRDDGYSSQNHEIGQRRTLCLCGTKNCRKYLPFSRNWV